MGSAIQQDLAETSQKAPIGIPWAANELYRRLPRETDPCTVNLALMCLAEHLALKPAALMETLTRTAVELCQAGSAGLWAPRRSGDSDSIAALSGQWESEIEPCLLCAAITCADVIKDGHPRLITATDMAKQYPALAALRPAAHEYLMVPFSTGGRTSGVLWVATHSAEHLFDDEDIRLLKAVGHFASAALQTADSGHALDGANAGTSFAGLPSQSAVTEQAITLAELERQRLFIERLTAVMPNTLRLFSRAEQRNLWINRHLGACLGYSSQDIAMLGEDFLLRVLYPDDVPALAKHQERVFLSADGEILEFEFRARDATGRWRWLLQHDTVFRRDKHGQTIDIVGTITDITDRKSAESALKVALALAEKANQSKSEFLSKMSHELRSPLNAMLGFAQLLESASPEASVSDQESVTEILKAGWYLLELIDQILDFSLMESDHLALTLEPVDLNDVLRDCHSIILHQARVREIHLLFPDAGDAGRVFADRTRLKQVLINLLSNAVKYNRVGGHVRVRIVSQPPIGLRVFVEDDGNGLLPGQLENLFQPFERLGQELGHIEGTGIGLAVSKNLVERMGGQIGADSVLGEGTRFWVDLVVAGKKRRPGKKLTVPGPEAS